MVTEVSYTCGEHRMTYREVESLCCIPESKVTSYVNYTQKKKKEWKEKAGDEMLAKVIMMIIL